MILFYFNNIKNHSSHSLASGFALDVGDDCSNMIRLAPALDHVDHDAEGGLVDAALKEVG